MGQRTDISTLTAFAQKIKDTFGIKDKTEAQALVLSSTYPNCVYYTSDTHCIVIGGNIYGRGEQIVASNFAFLPASEPGPGHDPTFQDTTKIYVQPDSSNPGYFKLWWYLQSDLTWINGGSFPLDIPLTAEDISYDLTPTPDLGTGDVQSAIEALDGKVEQLTLDTMGKDESGEYWEELLFERKGYSEISANNRRIGANHATTTDTSGVGRKIYIFPASEGDVFKVTGAAGSGDWTGFWKGGTAYSSITAANYLSSANTASGTYTAPANATLFAFVSIDARFTSDLAHVWKKTTRASKTPADIQRQLIELEAGCINTSALEVGEVMPYWADASTVHGIRLEVRKGQVLLLDLVGTATYAPLVFTDEDRVITEIHQTPVYGAFEAPNDGYAYLQKYISHDTDNYLYVMGYGGHAKDMVRIMEDTGEVADQKIDDEKVEFIKERFPSKNVSNYTRHIVNYKFEWVNGQAVYTANTSYRVGYYSKLVPKGSLCQLSLYYTSAPSTWGGLSMWGYSTTNIDDYIAENGSIVGLPTIRIKHIHDNGWIRDVLFIMPEDGYLIYAYQNTYSPTIGTSLIYDANDLTDLYTEYYKKGVADGAGMASIVGLGYNIWDYISGEIDLEGFEYGCELRRTYDKTPPSGSWQNKFKSSTKLVYFPSVDTSAVTNFSQAFYGCTKLKTIEKIDATGSGNIYQTFTNCANLVEANFEVVSSADPLDTFSGCSNLKKVTGFSKLSLLSNGCFRNCTKLESVDLPESVGFRGSYQVFQNCKALKYLPKLSTSSPTTFNGTFYNCSALVRIEELDFKNTADYGNANYNLWYSSGGTGCTSLRYVLIKNFGYQSTAVTYYGNRTPLWGIANDEVPDARQSLIDSLITYSFDRAAAGYSACTVTLSANTKALLTEEEIEQITAKGYTIV